MEVCDIVQEAVIKTISKKKKCKNVKWLSEEALQIAEKKREVKGKREKMAHSQECVSSQSCSKLVREAPWAWLGSWV